jgi:hypothetical protein
MEPIAPPQIRSLLNTYPHNAMWTHNSDTHFRATIETKRLPCLTGHPNRNVNFCRATKPLNRHGFYLFGLPLHKCA